MVISTVLPLYFVLVGECVCAVVRFLHNTKWPVICACVCVYMCVCTCVHGHACTCVFV